MEVKCFGDGLHWQELLCIPGSCIRGAPIPDTDTVAVAERSTIPLDVRSFGAYPRASPSRPRPVVNRNLPGAFILGGASDLRTSGTCGVMVVSGG